MFLVGTSNPLWDIWERNCHFTWRKGRLRGHSWLGSIPQEVRGKSKMKTFVPHVSLQAFEGESWTYKTWTPETVSISNSADADFKSGFYQPSSHLLLIVLRQVPRSVSCTYCRGTSEYTLRDQNSWEAGAVWVGASHLLLPLLSE